MQVLRAARLHLKYVRPKFNALLETGAEVPDARPRGQRLLRHMRHGGSCRLTAHGDEILWDGLAVEERGCLLERSILGFDDIAEDESELEGQPAAIYKILSDS